jgi:hypothetical protein
MQAIELGSLSQTDRALHTMLVRKILLATSDDASPPNAPFLAWWVPTDETGEPEALDEGDGVTRLDKVEQHGIRASRMRVSADPMAALANVLIKPAVNRIELLAEALCREGDADTNRKIVLRQMLLRS